jgi:Leucine-rich repeat (LRR) protein
MFKLIFVLFCFHFSLTAQNNEEGNYCKTDFLKSISGKTDTITVLKVASVCIDTLPLEVYELTNLKHISIDSHTGGQVYISANIEKLKNLESICLIKTGTLILPPEIGKLKKLKSIQINFGHMFTSLPKEIGQLENLEYLNLYRNKLTTLPKEIENLKHLKNLVLGENNFSEEEKMRIKKLLPNCKVDFSYKYK